MSNAILILNDVRVAGQHGGNAHMTYIPAHIINGKAFSQKLMVTVMRNTGRYDGKGKEITYSYRLTLWNGLADVGAKYLAIGKGIKFIQGECDSYLKTLYNQDGTKRTDSLGQIIQTTVNGVSVQTLDFGRDSAKLIEMEIQQGKRGQQWNVAGSQDQANYNARRDTIKAAVYDGQAPTWGYARVFMPQGASVNMEVYQKQAAKKNQAAPAPAASYNSQQFVNNVQHVANGGVPVPPAVNPAPVHQAAGSAPMF